MCLVVQFTSAGILLLATFVKLTACLANFTRSKSVIETVERGAKYVQSQNESEWGQWLHSGVFIAYFEHILHLFLVFQLLTLNN